MLTIKKLTSGALISLIVATNLILGPTVKAVVDITPPAILLSYPTDNTINVSVNVQPTLTFSEALNPTTVKSGNLELRVYAESAEDATMVPATFSLSAGDTVVTFNLVSPLNYNKQYYFFVGTGVKDVSGISFAGNTWYHAQRASHEFTTETAPITLSSIAITTPATRLVYTVGDPLDITGLVVIGTYSDASTKPEIITTANITGFDSRAPVTGQVLTITVNGKTATYTITVIVPSDTTPPVITLQGMSVMDIYLGSTYVDASATAVDNVDGNITANMVTVNLINTSLVGVYTVTYNISDAAGNPSVQVVRTVNVLPVSSAAQLLKENTTASPSRPEILVGDNDAFNSIITIPDNVTNATINLTALTMSNATSTTATIQGAMTVNASTTIGIIKVEIPAGTEIVSGTSTWNGIINVPQVKPNSTVIVTPDNGNTAEVSSVIEIGYGDIKLIFNKAVRLVLSGQTSKEVGYSRGGVFTKINTVCSADSQTAGNALPSEGDCKISIASDLIVWTKHFTNFATYTQTATPPVVVASFGGYSGGDSDYTAPIISNINLAVSAKSATITWITNESSVSWVVYGASASYGLGAKTTTYNTSHSLVLSNLSPGTTYHYLVKSGDSAGNMDSDTDKSFATTEESGKKSLGDVNKDNKIDILDFSALMVNWGSANVNNAADFNGDGQVNVFDFNLLMINWTN